MTISQHAQIKDAVNHNIFMVKKEISLLKEKSGPIAPDCSLGRLTRLEAMQEKEICAHTLEEALIRLNKLEYALRKIDDASYGVCMECEEPIAVGRLLLMPEASMCVACAQSR